jgi:tetratricopeptide (TPR) repeat protein
MFMLQIIGAGQGFLADRFTYIPYLGLFLGLGFVFQHFSNTSKDTMVKAIAGLALVVFMGLTWQQNKIWKNGETLWTHVIGAYEEAVTPWGNRANYYQSIKAYDQAIADYEAAIGIDPESNNLYSSLGKVYFDKGDVQNALKNYNKGLALPKPFGELYINRGAAYASLGQYDAALADINNGLALDEDNANGYLNRGLIHYQKKNLKNTISDLNRYFTYKPGTSEEWFILGLSYRNTDDAASAITAYNRAIQLKPTDKRYYNSRANAYRALGKNAEAAQDEAKARQL